jgi:hypothetical protein
MAKKKKEEISNSTIWIIAIAAVLILFNQIQLFQLNSMLGTGMQFGSGSSNIMLLSNGDLDSVNVEEIQSTAQAVAAVYDFSGVSDAQGVMDVMIPQGSAPYLDELGITYDDPVTALNFLARELFPRTDQEIRKNDEQLQRYINLASKPRGVSCEYCCGVGPIGATPEGKSRCGCTHNPGVLAITQYLIMYSDMTDAEILREVMRWKALWFPKNMVEIGLKIAGGDSSVLADVPSMVGGC